MAEFANTNASTGVLYGIMDDLANYEDDTQARLNPFVKLIAQSKATKIAATNTTQPEVKRPSVSLPTFFGTEDENWENIWN